MEGGGEKLPHHFACQKCPVTKASSLLLPSYFKGHALKTPTSLIRFPRKALAKPKLNAEMAFEIYAAQKFPCGLMAIYTL